MLHDNSCRMSKADKTLFTFMNEHSDSLKTSLIVSEDGENRVLVCGIHSAEVVVFSCLQYTRCICASRGAK